MSNAKNIVVFGAGGRTGREVISQALQAGLSVTAFVRTIPEHNALPLHERLRFITGDARNYVHVRDAIAGHDVVINVIAPKLGDSANYDISLVATRNILQAMKEQDVRRYIGQSGAWATEFIEDASIPMRIAFSIFLPIKNIYAYKKLEDAEVKHSELDWTLVRCGLLTDKPQAPIKVSILHRKCGLFEIPKISRKSVAAFHISILEDQNFYKKTPVIVN